MNARSHHVGNRRTLRHSADVFPSPQPSNDRRFQRLLDAGDWTTLPAPVRRRFSRSLAHAETAVFIGEVASTRITWAGCFFGQLARLFGAPLPLKRIARVPAAVLVTEDHANDCQVWTRVYHETGHLPQVIRSVKRFAGPTGLEECVGAGVGMALTLDVEQRALIFRSAGYFIRIAGRRWRIPDWLTPGRIEVIHREEREGRFSFTLTVTHALFGNIIHQVAFFRDRL
ncbi:MAG: DUF4166 domain-containing protein [Steroidobacteraceae bacterium]